jgi:hypothetical protein
VEKERFVAEGMGMEKRSLGKRGRKSKKGEGDWREARYCMGSAGPGGGIERAAQRARRDDDGPRRRRRLFSAGFGGERVVSVTNTHKLRVLLRKMGEMGEMGEKSERGEKSAGARWGIAQASWRGTHSRHSNFDCERTVCENDSSRA